MVTAVVLMSIAGPVACGLDSSRALTQALHRIWQVPQGLPEATIYAIRQTSDGYVWLGTQTGLVRFDGVRFVPVGDGTATWIRDLVEDGNHVLWAATNGRGLTSVEGGAVVRHALPNGLTTENVHELLCDSGGTIWACTGNGIARLTKDAATVYRTADGLVTNNVRTACEDRDGRIWVGGDSTQLSVWEHDHFVPKPLSSLPPFAGVRTLRCGADGTMWIGSTNGLVRLDTNGAERRFTVADGLADDCVNCLAASADGALWVGTNNGFSRLRNGEFDSFRARDGLSQSTVYALFEDREGSLWVGTKHGLNQFLDRRTIPFTQSEGLSSNDTGPVLQEGSGAVWVGTLDSGLNRFDGHRFSVLTERQGLASNSIRALAEDGAGGIWVGTDLGLNRLQDSKVTRTYTTKDGLPADEITCAFRPGPGRLWVGTASGVAQLVGERFVPLGASGMPASAAVTTIFNRRDDTVMIGTRGGGLYLCRDGRIEAINQGEARRPDVTSFFEDEDGLLWMGTIGGGLRLIDGARTVTVGMRDGLFDDDIYGIVKDDQDRLWMPCSKGIFYVSRSDLRRFAAGALHRVQCTPFSPTDALRTVECKSGVQPAAARMADGRLWFSTVRGVIVVDPQRIRRKAPPPPVVVEEMVVNGQRESGESKGRLSPGVKNLEFRYAGLSFLSPGRITFRYKLEGFDADWIDAGARREAFYTNLGPGTYTFRVTASNGDGTPTGSASPVVFSVAPYFYQWRGFIPVCVGVMGVAGWLAYRLRVRRIKGRMQDILTERSRIARELHDTLLQGFSGVTMEMQALSTRLPASGERATLEEIIRDAATCMREARRSVAGLRTPPGRQESSGFAAALAQVARQLTETRDVRLKLRLDGDPVSLPADAEYNLLRIASEAVSNAVRHSGARTIEVDLDCADGRLVLGVKDDGVGFDGEPAAGAYAGHYGLVGMRERAAQVGAELELQSQRGRGTLVTVKLPVSGLSDTAARTATGL